MAAEIGTGRQEYNYYDSAIDGKILKTFGGPQVGDLDVNRIEFWFSGNRLQFKKDPAIPYSEKRYETIPIQFRFYRNQIIGKFTGRWTYGSEPTYPFTTRKEYELKLFNPTITKLGDFTYYVNFCLKQDDVIKNAEQFTYSSNYVLMTDDGTVTGQVYKDHSDRSDFAGYFPHHDPDYPSLDCEKWDKYFGNLPWTGNDCPMMYMISAFPGNPMGREDLRPWYGYNYKPKRDISLYGDKTTNQYSTFNEAGDTTYNIGAISSTTVSFPDIHIPWLGGMIYNYGICMGTSPNPTREDNLLIDQRQCIIDNQTPSSSPLTAYVTKYFNGISNYSPGGGNTFYDLTPNTTYYFKVWEDVWGNSSLGEDPNQTYTKYSIQYVFTTPNTIKDPEIVLWTTAFGITSNSAAFQPGLLQKGDGNVEFGVCYRAGTQTPTVDDQTVVITGKEIKNIVIMTNCLPGTLYTFLPYAIRNKGQYNQEIFYCDLLKPGNTTLPGSAKINTFTTLSGPKTLPKVRIDYANLAANSAIDVKYTLTDNGGTLIREENMGVCWSTEGTPTISDGKIQDLIYMPEFYPKYARLDGLLSNTIYYFRAYATNSVGTAYSDTVISVRSGEHKSPNEVFTIYNHSLVTKNSARIIFDVNSLNSIQTSEIGVCYSKTQNPTIANNKKTTTNGVGMKIIDVDGLTDNSLYYYRAYYTDETGTYYSDQLSFTTLRNIVKPTISSISSTINDTSITLSTKISSDGGSTATNYIAYTKIRDGLTLSRPNFASIIGNGTGTFTANILKTALSSGTWYYCSYSTNEIGTTQSEIKTFIVEDLVTQSSPTLFTVVDSIRSTSAYWNSRIESLGNSVLVSASVVIKRASDNHVVYTNPTPLTPNDYGIINGLEPSTQYSLIFTVRTQYIIDNSLSDVVSTKTFTTLATTADPSAPTNPNIKISLTQRNGSDAKFTVAMDNVVANSIIHIIGKIGSIPNAVISGGNVDVEKGLINNLATQTITITLTKPGVWNFMVVLFDPSGITYYFSSNVIQVNITPETTTDESTGLPLYPKSGESKIIKGKRFVYNAIDNGWQRDYLYNPTASPSSTLMQARASTTNEVVQLTETVNQLRDQIQDVANNSFKTKNLGFESTEFNSALVVDTYTILTTVGSFGISFDESPILYRGVTDTNYTLLVEYASASMLGQGAKQDFTHTLKLQDGREFIRTLRHKTDNTGWEYSEFFEKKESIIMPTYGSMIDLIGLGPLPSKTDIMVLADEQNNPGKKSMYTWWPDGTIMYHMSTKDINDL